MQLTAAGAVVHVSGGSPDAYDPAMTRSLAQRAIGGFKIILGKQRLPEGFPAESYATWRAFLRTLRIMLAGCVVCATGGVVVLACALT
jgi:hypothetical protein